jgi:hypothetical protein
MDEIYQHPPTQWNMTALDAAVLNKLPKNPPKSSKSLKKKVL